MKTFFATLSVAFVLFAHLALARADACTGQCCNLKQHPECICECLGYHCGPPYDLGGACGGYSLNVSCGTCGAGTACLNNGQGETFCSSNYDPCKAYAGACGTFLDTTQNPPQTVTCPGCTGGKACTSDGVTPGSCVDTCATLGAACGTVNGQSCGACPPGQECLASHQCCYPKHCYDVPADCGDQSDGCGGVLHCGTCPSGRPVCNVNHCCKPKTCADVSAAGQCGANLADGCGGKIAWCDPPIGTVCQGNAVATCTPATCPAGVQCGEMPNGNCFGQTLNCGTCASGLVCATGICVSPAPAMPAGMTTGLGAMLVMFGAAFIQRVQKVRKR